MEIVISYLEEQYEQTSQVLSKAIKAKCKRKYLDFLHEKKSQFGTAISILRSENKTETQNDSEN